MVLGGSGFLGSHIIQAVQKAEIGTVTCGDVVSNDSLNCNYVKLDVLDINDITKKIDNFDLIINCIGQVTNPFNFCFKLNSIGISNLVKALSGKSVRLIHISTVAVYGSPENCNEETPLNPETSYATAKAFAEQILLDNYDNKKLTILRISNLYGGRQMKGIFAYLLRSYHSDRKLNFNNDGTLTRSFMHVDDCADIIMEVLKNGNLTGIYNIKGHETYSVKELVQQFENRFNVVFKKSLNQTLPWENIENLEDTKLRSLINLQPKWHLFDFIEKELGNRIYA
jgi:nucleoside-diphosphate-sugar epimerase